jgi:hypothetical protein
MNELVLSMRFFMIYYHFVWQVLSDIFYTMISNNPLCRSALSSLLNIEATLCRLEVYLVLRNRHLSNSRELLNLLMLFFSCVQLVRIEVVMSVCTLEELKG